MTKVGKALTIKVTEHRDSNTYSINGISKKSMTYLQKIITDGALKDHDVVTFITARQ